MSIHFAFHKEHARLITSSRRMERGANLMGGALTTRVEDEHNVLDSQSVYIAL